VEANPARKLHDFRSAEATQCRWKSGEIAERRAGVYFVIVSPVRRLTLAMMSYSAAIASLTYLDRLLLDRLLLDRLLLS
jgi:hypothetical protein